MHCTLDDEQYIVFFHITPGSFVFCASSKADLTKVMPFCLQINQCDTIYSILAEENHI
jgi:hypothetical protein